MRRTATVSHGTARVLKMLAPYPWEPNHDAIDIHGRTVSWDPSYDSVITAQTGWGTGVSDKDRTAIRAAAGAGGRSRSRDLSPAGDAAAERLRDHMIARHSLEYRGDFSDSRIREVHDAAHRRPLTDIRAPKHRHTAGRARAKPRRRGPFADPGYQPDGRSATRWTPAPM